METFVSSTAPVAVQVLLPVHNEATSIEKTMREAFESISPQVNMEFIICEDGSTDGTKNILYRLAENYPLRLITAEAAKGYSRAVRDGMRAMSAPYLLCMDSDGQCDPADFQKFWEARRPDGVNIGWRTQRADTKLRIILSRTFFIIFKLFFHVSIHDPSCPSVLAGKEVIGNLVNEMGSMQEGFWWEFVARAFRHGYKILEIPVHHRPRISGGTQVYKIRKMPGIFIRHFLALFRIRWHAK
jgi:glycosyltransferase involved in cell wall biosynthesis